MPYETGPESPKRIDELDPRAPFGTDFIPICPANGPTYRASVQEIVNLAGNPLPAITPANVGQILAVGGGLNPEWTTAQGGSGGGLPNGDATNSSLVWDVASNTWKPSRIVREAQNIHAGGIGTIPYQIGEHMTAHLAIGTKGQVLTVHEDGPLLTPKWENASGGLPAINPADKGKFLVSKADGSGTDWHTIADMNFNIADMANTATDLDSNLYLVGSYIDSLSDKTKCKNVTLNALLAANEIKVEYSNTIETFTANSVANVYCGNGGIFGFGTCPKLKSISFSSLKNIYGTLKADSCPLLTTISLNPVYAATVNVRDNAKLTSFNLYALESSIAITVANNPLLVNFGFGGMLKRLDGNFDGSGCGFSASTVNDILAALAKLDGSKGTNIFGTGQTVDLSGGTNAAPTGQGIIDAQKIIARGGTVKVNGTAITTTKKLIQAPEFDTVADPGKVLSVKADGTGAEWKVAGGLPTIGSNDSGKILTVSPDGVSAIWEKAVGEINYDGTSTLANVLSFNSPALTQVRLFGMPNLVNAEIEAHLRIDDVSVNANPKLTSFSLSSKRVRNLSIQGNTLLNSVWMSFDDVDGGINITNNAALTSLSLTVNKSISGDVSLLNGKFDANTINSILKMLVDLNGIGGKFEYGAGRTVDLSGGTNAAPAGQGIIDAQTLIARGATVKVNGTAITTTRKKIHAPEFDTATDKGKVLAVKADGSGLEWIVK